MYTILHKIYTNACVFINVYFLMYKQLILMACQSVLGFYA